MQQVPHAFYLLDSLNCIDRIKCLTLTFQSKSKFIVATQNLGNKPDKQNKKIPEALYSTG